MSHRFESSLQWLESRVGLAQELILGTFARLAEAIGALLRIIATLPLGSIRRRRTPETLVGGGTPPAALQHNGGSHQ